MALAGGVCVMGSPGLLRRVLQAARPFRRRPLPRPTARTPAARCGPKVRRCSCCSAGRARCATGGAVLAEVRASCVNSGRPHHRPDRAERQAQARLFHRAIDAAGVRPEDIGMIEGHGTGTRLGDRTELRSLAQTYGATAPGRGRAARLGQVQRRARPGRRGCAGAGQGAASPPSTRAVPPACTPTRRSREIDWDSTGSTAGHQADAVARRSTADGSPRCRRSA